MKRPKINEKEAGDVPLKTGYTPQLPPQSLTIFKGANSGFDSQEQKSFFYMGHSGLFFVYFRPFLSTISLIQIEKSVDGVLGI